MRELFSLADANVRFVLLGSLLIGCTSGLLGTFAVLRKRSLVGDALAHAALPGVALAFMLTGSKNLMVLIAGASVSGVLGVLLIQLIVNNTRIKADAALGIVLSVFFGGGIVLLTHIQRSAVGNQSGLDKFLFGQAAAMVGYDLQVMTALSIFIIIFVLLFYKEFKALIFDPDFLTAIGHNARAVDLLLMALIVLTVMVGLQAVGVVLIAAMLITPAVAARFWTNKLFLMMLIAALIGGLSGVGGTFTSSLAPRIPTGPMMVLFATGFFLISAIAAPERGVVARLRRLARNRYREASQHILRGVWELLESNGGKQQVSLDALAGRLQLPASRLRRVASRMRRSGLLQLSNGHVEFTDAGEDEALFVVKSHRLWEYYLVYRSILEPDHVDRPADEIEHVLTREMLAKLEEVLRRENVPIDDISSIHEEASGFRRRMKNG